MWWPVLGLLFFHEKRHLWWTPEIGIRSLLFGAESLWLAPCGIEWWNWSQSQNCSQRNSTLVEPRVARVHSPIASLSPAPPSVCFGKWAICHKSQRLGQIMKPVVPFFCHWPGAILLTPTRCLIPAWNQPKEISASYCCKIGLCGKTTYQARNFLPG